MCCKSMDKLLKNVAARRNMFNNAGTLTRRVTKKRYTGRNKRMKNIKKRGSLMSLRVYIMMSYLLGMTHLRVKMKNQQGN